MMNNLLRVEFYKLRRFGIFYIAILLMMLLCVYTGVKNQIVHLFANIYEVFADGLHDNSFTFFLALTTAFFVGNDFSTRTLNRELVTGVGRFEIIISRILPVWIMNVAVHFIWLVCYIISIGIGVGFAFSGFVTSDIAWAGTVVLQIMALSTVLMLITFICGKVNTALTATVITVFFMCNILKNFVSADIYRCSCFCFAPDSSSGMLIKCSVCAVITIIAGIAATYLVFVKRDIS